MTEIPRENLSTVTALAPWHSNMLLYSTSAVSVTVHRWASARQIGKILQNVLTKPWNWYLCWLCRRMIVYTVA